MTDLPIPVTPIASDQTQAPGNVTAASSISMAQTTTSSDPKLLQEQAIEHIEAAILQTATNPGERAKQIQAIKSAYIKARFGVSIDGSS
jgi:hypothetical protein